MFNRNSKVRKKADLTRTKVGFYGCVGKVVRIGATGYFPINIRVHCPACGHFHIIRPFWRKTIDTLDKGVVPDLVLEAPSATV